MFFFFFNDKKVEPLYGNIGEWSELYVFLRLLSSGKLDVAGDNLITIQDQFYKVLAVLRKESKTNNEYIRSNDVIRVKVIDDETSDIEEFEVSIKRFTEYANLLLDHLNKLKGKRSVYYEDIQQFMDELKIYSIKDYGHKRDISLSIEDFRSRLQETLGFSIKSYLGQPATLFNPAAGANFIYRVEFPKGSEIDCDTFNRETYIPKKPNTINPFTGKISRPNKICGRVQRIEELGGKIIFDHIQSECLTQNLRTIDSEMPTIMAYVLLLRYRFRVNNWEHILKILNKINPLGYRISEKSPAYEYKIKRFLNDSALGMVSDEPWDGTYDATGGQIIVKHDGDIVCYHVYQLNKYLDYLLRSTALEQPSTSEDKNNPGHPSPNPKKRFFFGWLYKENGNYYIKLCLQVRFKRVSKKKKKKK